MLKNLKFTKIDSLTRIRKICDLFNELHASVIILTFLNIFEILSHFFVCLITRKKKFICYFMSSRSSNRKKNIKAKNFKLI